MNCLAKLVLYFLSSLLFHYYHLPSLSVLLQKPPKQSKRFLCVCAKSFQLCPTLGNYMGCILPAPLSMGFSRHEYRSVLPCSTPGDLPIPGIGPASPVSPASPALSGQFFTISTTWEDQMVPSFHLFSFISRSKHRIGEGDGTPLQSSCLENPMDGGAW